MLGSVLLIYGGLFLTHIKEGHSGTAEQKFVFIKEKSTIIGYA
jgi:hypothetical protein